MSCHLIRAMLSAACLLLPVAATAADPTPVEDFARHVLLSDPTLSPDGKHIAVNVNDISGDSHALVVYDVGNMKAPVCMLRLPKFEIAADITWVSNLRLVLDKGSQYGSIDKPSLTGEILATDFDGKHQDYLYGFKSGTYGTRAGSRGSDEGWGTIDGLPTPTNGHFYLSTQSWGRNDCSTIYDVDATHGSRHLIGQLAVPGMSFMVGADGMAHYAFGTNDDFKNACRAGRRTQTVRVDEQARRRPRLLHRSQQHRFLQQIAGIHRQVHRAWRKEKLSDVSCKQWGGGLNHSPLLVSRYPMAPQQSQSSTGRSGNSSETALSLPGKCRSNSSCAVAMPSRLPSRQ